LPGKKDGLRVPPNGKKRKKKRGRKGKIMNGTAKKDGSGI